ncbi:MAG: GNAT family N-acetyltransferase [Acidimicrobiales bacterium]
MEAVRPAGPGDLARCAELVAAAQAEAATVRGGELLAVLGAVPTAAHGAAGTGGRAEPEALVDAWASGDPSRVLLVGLYEGETVGVGTGHLVEGHSRHVGRIDCCYVEPEARQVGVGGALIGGLLDWFGERGCTDVDSVALPGDRATKQLLETAGFKARLLVLHRSLG